MFDIGWSELLVIGIVALVVIGPKELPGVLRTVGQMVGKLRRMAGEFQGQFQEALREAELDGLKKGFTDFAEEANKSIAGALPSNPLLDLQNEVKAAKDAIEGRKDEPETKVDDATAEAEGIDPVTGQAKAGDAASAAVEAQLPKPEAPAEPYAFEDIVSGVAATAVASAVTAGATTAKPEPLPAAQTQPVEAKPLDTKPVDAKPAEVKPAAPEVAKAPSGVPAPAASAHAPSTAEPRAAEVRAPEAKADAPKRKPRVVTADAAAARVAIEGAPADLFDVPPTASAKPIRRPRVVGARPRLHAAAALDETASSVDKPKRKPRVKVKTPSAGDEGPGEA